MCRRVQLNQGLGVTCDLRCGVRASTAVVPRRVVASPRVWHRLPIELIDESLYETPAFKLNLCKNTTIPNTLECIKSLPFLRE